MDTLHLTLRQLQIFAAVAKHGSTSAAAHTLALSQSAASAALNELERLLALPLFDRVGKRLLLNDNGRALWPQALALLDGAGAIERWAYEVDSQVGALRIGASTTVGNYRLPAALAGFKRSLPPVARERLQMQVSIGNSAAVVAQVAAFELDLGIIEGPCHDPHLEVIPWIEDELVLVAAADSPLLRPRGRIGLPALRDATWLLREPGSGTREMVDELLIPHLQQLKAGIEFGNSEAIKHAVASGLGISCLSRFVVEDQLKSGALVAPRTALPRLNRRWLLVVHRRKQRTRGLSRLLDYLQQVAQASARAAGASRRRPR